MSPAQKAKRLDLIAAEVEGTRLLVVAARVMVDQGNPNSTEAEEANALCELLYAIGDRLKATASNVRAAGRECGTPT